MNLRDQGYRGGSGGKKENRETVLAKNKKIVHEHIKTQTHRISATIILVPLSQTLREMGQAALDWRSPSTNTDFDKANY